MKFILGEKLEMSQVFAANGTVVPVTLVKAGPCVVTQIKTTENDGVSAVQIGFRATKNLTQPEAGHLKDLPQLAVLRDFSLEGEVAFKRGDAIEANIFQIGDTVHVVGQSKGKGFQGVVKRHGFHGHPKSHGHKDQERMPGSIGAGGPQHVFKGRRMGGHMGDERVTVKNLEVIEVRDGGILALKGAVPGARHAIIEIRST